jgi:hypothetical protein
MSNHSHNQWDYFVGYFRHQWAKMHPGPVPDTTPPTVPTGLTIGTRTGSTIAMSWNPSTDSGGSGLKGYTIQQSLTQNGIYTAVGTALAPTTSFIAPNLSYSTTYWFKVLAFDNTGNNSAASSAVSGPTLANNPPVFTVAPTTFAPSGLPANVQFTAVDPEGLVVTYSLVGSPANISINSNTGLVTVSSGATYQTITVRATDPFGMSADVSCLLNILTLNNPGAQSWTVGVAVSLQLVALGGSGTKTYSASGLPTGVTLNTGTGLISGTPTTATTSSITATVTDSSGSTSQTFGWTVAATGALATGQPFTVSGSGFGTRSSVAPIIFSTFEEGTNGTPITGTYDVISGNLRPPLYSTDQYWEGTKSAYLDFIGSQYNCTLEKKNLGALSQFYISYRLRVTRYNGVSSRNIKLARISGGGDGYPEPLVGYTEFTEEGGSHIFYSFMAGNTLPNTGTLWSSWAPTRDTWQRLEYFVRLNTGTNPDGHLEIRADRGLQEYYPNAVLSNQSNTTKFNWLTLPYYVAHDAGGDYGMWLDDVWFDSTPQRVEIGNASTWAACTESVIQPLVSWSNTSVTFTGRISKFTAGTQVWIYVINAVNAATMVSGPHTV